jgi:hypothetical protein
VNPQVLKPAIGLRFTVTSQLAFSSRKATLKLQMRVAMIREAHLTRRFVDRYRPNFPF